MERIANETADPRINTNSMASGYGPTLTRTRRWARLENSSTEVVVWPWMFNQPLHLKPTDSRANLFAD
jgi:hypothetical protein